MVKKTKKDEKGPPKNQFDPLLVESSQAATVVLMLKSTEDEILIKACEAIYKFVQKCDANKKLLLDLDSVPLLLKLAQHENCEIHRNACMVLGTLSQHVEGGKILKKFDELIPTMISLLSSDEENTVHEYSLLCLCSLGKFFNGICSIREHNGLESIVRCLASSDQDVINNAIQIIALMLEDYQTKSGIREKNGFLPILELLVSEYPDIQFKALIALKRITEDAANRDALRELGAFSQLVDFIGTPSYNDLHVLAVKVLSNCFEDVETVKVNKENGVLARLIAIVTDAPPPLPPAKDDKKSKKVKSARDGKKGKGDDKKGKKTAMSADSNRQIIPTLPEVKEFTAWAIVRAAKKPEIRKLLQEQEIEKMLILLLNNSDAKVKVASSQAIRAMAENLLSRDITGKLCGIPPLMKMVVEADVEDKESALTSLDILTTDNEFNCIELSKCEQNEALISLLYSSRDVSLFNALGILFNMAHEETLRHEITEIGVIPAIVGPLSSQSSDVQSKAALAVTAYVLESDNRQQFVAAEGVRPLVNLLDSSNKEVRRNATQAIVTLTQDAQTAQEICQHGGLDFLRYIETSETLKTVYTDEAIAKLLEHNLSAKYALIGKLCPHDLIIDGFYDVGRIRPGNRFLPLSQYRTQPVTGNRPILFAYAPNETRESGRESVGCRGSSQNSRDSCQRNNNNNKSSLLTCDDVDNFETMTCDNPFAVLTTSVDRQTSPLARNATPVARDTTPVSKETDPCLRKSNSPCERGMTPRGSGRATPVAKDTDPCERELTPVVMETSPCPALARRQIVERLDADRCLVEYIREINEILLPFQFCSCRERAILLAQFVADKMGGAMERSQLVNFSWEHPQSELKYQMKSNVLAIGMITRGVHFHRALLFKVLGDRFEIPSTLIRGDYNIAWNELYLEDQLIEHPKYPPKSYIIDLMFQPGQLMRTGSPEAAFYTKP